MRPPAPRRDEPGDDDRDKTDEVPEPRAGGAVGPVVAAGWGVHVAGEAQRNEDAGDAHGRHQPLGGGGPGHTPIIPGPAPRGPPW